jgi:hypothetical protein
VRRAERAEEYRAIMAAEPSLTRAALARRLGVSRAWISRVLEIRAPSEADHQAERQAGALPNVGYTTVITRFV